MKFSVQWLQECLDSPVNTEDLVSKFTMSGLEVDSLRPASGEFENVIIGQIEKEWPHPDAKRLHCCLVNIGKSEPLSIVCGGTNVRPGLKIALAMVGAKLPGGVEIKQSIIRGQPSQGMICSSRELGLGEDKEGHILELPEDAPLGVDLKQYLNLPDQIMDLSITANRGDCLSIQGLARETAALLKIKSSMAKIQPAKTQSIEMLKVSVPAPERCPRYLGRVVRNIRHPMTTPVWMQERLRRSGIRSIHPVVDITNYVMLELGQPLHAFNLENIAENIQVRLAKSGEAFTLLDGRRLELSSEDLVIADQNQPLALAGVMGGVSSSVAVNTRHIFLESAFFNPIPLSLTARRYGLQTDSAFRYARGVDYELPQLALERATQLILDIVGGEAGPITEKTHLEYLPKKPVIQLRRKQIVRILGLEFTDQQVESILQSLGLKCSSYSEGWQVEIPSFRFDLKLEVDLIEELGRLRGYQEITPQKLRVDMKVRSNTERTLPLSRWFNLFTDHGYCEAVTYSFVHPKWQEWLDPENKPIALANPISPDMSVMRTSLWPGLLQAVQYNQNRQLPRIRLFEIGRCFFQPQDKPQQIVMLGGVASGQVFPEQWGAPARAVDFYDVKGDLQVLLALTGSPREYYWRPGKHLALHPGQNAEIWRNEQLVGYLGALHPKLLEKCDLIAPVIVFQLKFDLINIKQHIEFKNFSKFPSVRRDIAVIVVKTISAEAIEKFIIQKAGKLLNNVQIFDVYQGQNIEKGSKSVALAMTFQDATRTLKDDEIQTLVDDLIKGLGHEFNAKLRM